jgi:serine/threonine-protein kinase RsbW
MTHSEHLADSDAGHRMVELTIKARPENLVLARLALAGVSAVASVPAELIADLKLAVTEACTNAIEHAYLDSPEDQEITIRYRLAADALEVEVEDNGVGFSPEGLSMVRESNGSPDGMGLILVRALTDELDVASTGSGSRVSFRRRFGSG